jgi:type II secretory pathway component PulL
MPEKLKTICLILITLTVVVSAVFWCWSILKKQAYYERQEMRQYYQDMRDRGIKIPESRLPPDL